MHPSNMNLSIIVLLSLSLSPSLFLLSASAASQAPVRDINGRSLRHDRLYYILPATFGLSGGLTFESRNVTCPVYVAEDKYEVDNGYPVSFSPVDPSDSMVRLSTDINVNFADATICGQSTVWRLGDVEGTPGRRYVATGGVRGRPGLATLSNWFKIESYDRVYKLVFCPEVCSVCKVLCGDLGIISEGGNRWLGLNDVPLPVVFKEKIK